ncbi:Rhs element protein [Shigella sonnei]|nr:Rhs element protein [Shigella sonnei]
MSTGLRFTLEVDGLPPDAFAVVSFHLNQSLSSLFSLELSLVSQQFLSLEFPQVLDKMAYLTIWQGDDVQRRVKGVVTWFELGENDKNQMLYSMKVCPPLWRTGLRQNFRIFQNEDIESILATILKENGVTEWSPLFSEPHPSREFCVQYGETDYDFLCRMAAEEGIFFYEEHAQKSTDQSLVLCDTVRYLPESFEIPWNPNTRTEVSTFCISQFRYSAQIRPSSVVTKDYTFKRPGWAGRFDQEGQYQDYQRTQYEVYDYPGRFKGAHGQNFARWQMDGWRNNAEVARGTSRSPEIWPGRRIVLTGHPQANLNREWQVVASELHGEQPQAVPGRSGSGTTLNNHFAVIPADRTWRPQPLLKPLVDGPQSAVVTGPAGEEIFCDEHGRVRVKFNWDRYNPSNQDSSCWIRVAQAWAGTGFGNLAIPRVGQEVIVDFLNGDPDQPIIMGRTYHQENRTPGSLPGTKTQMTIRSKTYKGSGFNELKFDDATGKEQVYIHVQKNMNTEVLNNRTTDVINNHALSLVSQQFLSLEFPQVLDKMAYLTIWQGDDVQRRVKGVVTWFELGENDKNQMLYSMKVCPPLWRTGLRQNFRIFQNEDIESILATILKENGVTEWSPLFSEPHPSREFCVQYGETDYDFLCRMAAEEGIFFYEEHAQKSTDQSLVLCDTVRYLPESFEIPWNPNTRTEVSTLCISQFRYSAQIRPSSVVTKDYTFKRPGWPGRFDQEGQYQDYQRTQYEVYDYPGRFKGAHGQNFARWQMDGWRNNAEVARGTSRSPEIWPGRRIVLTGHPQANLNREWQVVASDLHGEQPQAVPGRRGSGTTLENHFAVIPADRTWRPQPLMKPLVDGPQSAVVTGPAGEEIFCDEHGRVRVKFNWDRYNPSNQDSSCWIRVAQAWAGTGFGNLAIPRVGQEVIVDFLNGDPDQPIIMGRTYHQENRTPGSLPGTKTQMTIRSKTYKGSGFNELKFDDATGKEQVYIHAQKNMNTEVLNNRTTDVINNHAETIGNNQMIAVTNNQIETVGVNQIETVGSNQIIKVGSVQVETIGLVRALTVGVAYQTTVGGIMNTSVALMQSSQIGLHKSLRVGLGYDVKVGNNVTFTVGKTKKDDTGQTAIYSAGEHLELCCGKARLVLTKDGQIFLNGTKIHLQGKEQVNGDSLLINWNCAASKSPPKTPDEKQDTPDMREY